MTQNGHHDKKPRPSVSDVISLLCKYLALAIAVVVFATTILDREIGDWAVPGLSLSIALIAIALLQGSSTRR